MEMPHDTVTSSVKSEKRLALKGLADTLFSETLSSRSNPERKSPERQPEKTFLINRSNVGAFYDFASTNSQLELLGGDG